MIRCRVSLVACILFVAVDAQWSESDCGTLVERGQSTMENEAAATNLIFPWHVGVYRQTGNEFYQPLCGGTLISSDIVISAASCFYNETLRQLEDAREFIIVAGKDYRDSPNDPHVQKSAVKSIRIPERYNGSTGNYHANIAFVRVEAPFSTNALVKPVCVHWDILDGFDYPLSGRTGKVVGWGLTEAIKPSEILKEISFPSVHSDDCLAALVEDSRKGIAPYALLGSILSVNDIGGGLCFEYRGRWYLRGIVTISRFPSIGTIDLQCDRTKYVPFTDVDFFLKWICSAVDDTRIAADGCTLPNQPRTGSFQLKSPDECDSAPGSVVPIGSVLLHSCGNDHILEGNEISTCRVSGWDSLPTCIKNSKPNNEYGGCTLPEQPIGGQFEIDSCTGSSCNVTSGGRVASGTFLTLRCHEGYALRGNAFTACRRDDWYLPPICVKTCPPLTSRSVDIDYEYQSNGLSRDSIIFLGTQATLKCKPFYEIHQSNEPGYRSVTCLESGEWGRPLFDCTPECGKAGDEAIPLVAGGYETKDAEFPWHVGIYRKRNEDEWTQICGGTLVKPNLVVSAAHCFYNDIDKKVLSVSQFAVAAGKTYRSYSRDEPFAQRSFVKEIHIHDKYYGVAGNYALDIALVRTNTSFIYTGAVRPVCIDVDSKNNDLRRGSLGKVSGWGIADDGKPSPILRKIELPYIPHEDCIELVPFDFKDTVSVNDKFCGGYLNGSSTCPGDSGGGLCFRSNGLWYLRGIVSVAPHPKNTDVSCESNYYTVFTDVSEHLGLIRGFLV